MYLFTCEILDESESERKKNIEGNEREIGTEGKERGTKSTKNIESECLEEFSMSPCR